MKMRFKFPDGVASAQTQTQTQTQRGAAPIGLLHELPQIELAAIVYLRAWCDGDERATIGRDFHLVLENAAANKAVEDFDALIRTLLENARRPLMRHALDCRCFGGDESAFANLVAASAAQDREDALLFASTLMRGHAAWASILLAERLGQVFLRLARTSTGQPVLH